MKSRQNLKPRLDASVLRVTDPRSPEGGVERVRFGSV
jgi:hypothetical protein